jgi:hypothetical protein
VLNRREWIAGVGAAAVLRGASPERALFDGKSLAGWKEYGGGSWTVEDGAIVARFDKAEPGPGFLFTTEEFGDFRLRLEFWVSKGGNSGVFVRQRLREFGRLGDERPAQQAGDGVEVQIDYNDPKNYTGSIYNKRKPDKVVGAEEQWNRYEIDCRGPRVVARVNGEQVNDWSGLAARGAIGFQMHGQKPHDHVVKFRNVRIEVFA